LGIALASDKEITVNRTTKMVSNPEGITLLNMEKRFDAQFEHLKAQIQEDKAQLAQLQEERQEDKAQLAQLQEERQEDKAQLAQLQEERLLNIESKERWHDIRKTTLDEWSRQSRTYTSERLERNDSVHGGSLWSDIEVISSFPLNSDTNRKRVACWKKAFKQSYGLSYDDLRQGINDIPDKVLLAFNRRASAGFWEDHENSIKSNADTIIEEWRQNPNDPDLFKEGSRAQTSFIKIEEEWIQMLLPPSDQQSGDQ
jgi:cell division protein FtsB